MHDQIQRIRHFINRPRKQYILLKDRALWLQLCSCLDVIEDSELAIDAYSARESEISVGADYLAVYGVLQALFLQQDAIDNLCKSLRIPETIYNYPRLKEIREIRSESIGHPTRKNKKGRQSQPPSYHFISRPTLGHSGFQLLSSYSNGKSDEFKDVSILNLIADQKEYTSNILTLVIEKLEQEEAAHKEKFRTEKLASVFSDTLDYDLGKVLEFTLKSKLTRGHAAIGEINLQQIRQMLQALREALAKRGIELKTYDCIKDVYRLVEYPLDELEGFFQSIKSGEEPNINQKTAYMFAFFVEKQVADLRQVAKEIDEYYSS
jgi:hypothetical protein